MSHNVNSRAMKTKNSEPDYRALHVQAMQQLNDYMRETLQLRKYIHALEMDAFEAFMHKSEYFEHTTTTKFC